MFFSDQLQIYIYIFWVFENIFIYFFKYIISFFLINCEEKKKYFIKIFEKMFDASH